MGLAKLLPGFGVLNGLFQQRIHRPDRFGSHSNNGLGDNIFHQGQGVAHFSQHVSGAYAHLVERQIRTARTIHQRVAAPGDPGTAGIDYKKAYTLCITAAPGGTGH